MSEPINPTGKASRHKRRQRRTGAPSSVVAAQATLLADESAPAAGALPRFARATEPTPYAPADEATVVAPTDVASPQPVAALPPEENSRQAFAQWLRQARQAKGMSLEQMAQTTRIQARVLACLEAAQFDALHADVFVRGYLRSYAQCVGLDGSVVLERYAACGLVPGPVAAPTASHVAATVSAATTMRFGAPPAAAPAVVEPAPAPVAAVPATDVPVHVAPTKAAEGVPMAAMTATASSKMPRPHLVIDDANPELAEREAGSKPRADRDWGDGSFSSPFLRGEREPKQTGLTLAVIVLLIAATIALSYLMKTTPATRGVTTASAPLLGVG